MNSENIDSKFEINGTKIDFTLHEFPFQIKSFPRPYLVNLVTSISQLNNYLIDVDYLIIDKNILDLYEINFSRKSNLFVINALELNKNLKTVIELINKLTESQISKGSKVLAIGGGIIQDIAACACALFRRGQPFIYMPTTTLGQLDSCIGAKCAVNTSKAKNIVGLFSAPSMVLIPTFMIETMNLIEHRAGLSEMLRLCLTLSNNAVTKYIKYLNDISTPDKLKSAKYLNALKLSLCIKKSVVEFDEYENDIRRSMNYGHTFGHAIEKLSNYQIPHGLAVLLGMHISNIYSNSINLMSKQVLDRVTDSIYRTLFGLNIDLNKIITFKPIDIIYQFRFDKKGDGSSVPLIILIKPGKMIFRQFYFDNNDHKELLESIENGLEDFKKWLTI